MTAPAIADCAGLWRRTLLIDADGSHHTEAGVVWLQGISAYVDSRGFGGRLEQRGDVFEWQRDVDLEPPGPFPDAGSMHWDGEVLVETGVHEDYAEHWVRDADSAGPCSAVFLRAPDGAAGLLVRVGDQFGWAGAGTVVIAPVGGPEWGELAIAMSDDEVHAAAARWTIERREGNVIS
ncbi:hypothetical protein [Mycolicibacterium sp.]|uniref:hypothetical protein n=1 Tax=Mycolicibacterium sp. TaxID=2320850 RepID=UPI001A3426A9|nr:hypothetical protein [Mycolicibacterium sp.]MBJ7336228.1 hypothetical protein [Mycolicibacterium sp.]